MTQGAVKLVLVWTLASGLAVLGCSSGSKGGGGGGSTAAGVLPSESRNANGYDFQTTFENQAATSVSALGVAANSTGTLAASTPGGLIDLIQGTSISTNEANLGVGNEVTGIGSVGTVTFATTGGALGSGGVYERDANGNWIRAFTPPRDDVAAVGWRGELFVFAGQSLSIRDAAGSYQADVAVVASLSPVAAVVHNGAVWVGGASIVAGDAPVLYTGTASSLISVAIPASATTASSGSGTTTTPPPSSTPPAPVVPGYNPDVAQLVALRCATCHGNGANGLPAAQAVFSLASPANVQADFDSIVNVTPSRVNPAAPATSQLLLKASNDSSVGGHIGGALWVPGSAEYQVVLDWIIGGASLNRPQAPAPPPPAPAPAPAPTASLVDRITALLDVTGGNLIVAIGHFDSTTGAAQSGNILHWNGADFTILQSFSGEAPLSLAFQDNTVYAGTSGGRLVYRDGNGAWQDEPGLPANTAITSLFAPDGATLMIGVAGTNGATVIKRSAIAAAPAPAPQTTTTTPGTQPSNPTTGYVAEAKPILLGCDSCHNSGGAASGSSFILSLNMANDASDHAAVLGQVNTADPANSQLLLKSTNQVVHTGGNQLTVGSPGYNQLLTWIQNGANF